MTTKATKRTLALLSEEDEEWTKERLMMHELSEREREYDRILRQRPNTIR